MKMNFYHYINLYIIVLYIYTYIYSQLSVSRTTDKLDFSISRTHLFVWLDLYLVPC